MLLMVNEINKTTFGGRNVVTCNTCHRGRTRPVGAAFLPVGGGEELPGGIANPARQGREVPISGQAPTVDQLFDRYANAIGGNENLAKITSRVGKGVLTNFAHLDQVHEERPVPTLTPVDLVVKGDKSMMVTHNANGDVVAAYNSGSAWNRAANGNVTDMRPDLLDVAKLHTAAFNPAMLKQVVTGMTVTGTGSIGNYETNVITGRMTTLPVVKLHFDQASGVLVSVLYQQPSGFCCHVFRIDYADWTVQNGIRVPMRWTVVGPRDSFLVYRMDEMQLNAAVDDSRFAKPAGR